MAAAWGRAGRPGREEASGQMAGVVWAAGPWAGGRLEGVEAKVTEDGCGRGARGSWGS